MMLFATKIMSMPCSQQSQAKAGEGCGGKGRQCWQDADHWQRQTMLAQWYPYCEDADNAGKDASELNARVSELSGQVSVLAWNLEKANRQINHQDQHIQSLQQSLKKAYSTVSEGLCEVVRLLHQDLASEINHQDQHIQSLQQGMIRRGKQLTRQDQQIQSMQEKVQKLLSDFELLRKGFAKIVQGVVR